MIAWVDERHQLTFNALSLLSKDKALNVLPNRTLYI